MEGPVGMFEWLCLLQLPGAAFDCGVHNLGLVIVSSLQPVSGME